MLTFVQSSSSMEFYVDPNGTISHAFFSSCGTEEDVKPHPSIDLPWRITNLRGIPSFEINDYLYVSNFLYKLCNCKYIPHNYISYLIA